MSEGSLTRYDVVVDPREETSHGKLVRFTGHGKRVLDLGCATGGVARALVQWDCRVWGVEIDPEAGKRAEGACEAVVIGDLDALDLGEVFDGLSFDVVLAGDVFEHLKDPRRTLRQARELLADGGYVVLSVPNMSHGSVRLALLHGDLPPSDTGLLDSTHLQYLTRARLLQLVSDAGFAPAYLDGTRLPIEQSEVPFPDDELTRAVSARLAADPDSEIYQFVAILFPGAEDGLPPLAQLTWRLSDELQRSRAHAAAWESRGVAAESALAEIRADIDRQVASGLAPLRQELLVARDQLMHRDHDVKRVVDLYEHHTAGIRQAEQERERFHELMRQAERDRDAAQHDREALLGSRTWRIGQAVSALARGDVRSLRRR